MSSTIKIPEETREQQSKASDPENSSWLSANAGSGKTHVLTQRVIRILLDGTAPDRIMCLTFTKAAAANMKNRVFETLSTWTMMEDDALSKEIYKTTGKASSPRLNTVARQLFAKALDTPGGLKIQTIHGFCESLLHQFPLEANVPGHFETVQELEQEILLRQATSDILGGDNPTIAEHYAALIPEATDSAIEEAISELIAKREAFERWYTLGGEETPIKELYELFGISPGDTAQTVMQTILDGIPVSSQELKEITELAYQGTAATDIPFAEAIQTFLESSSVEKRYFALLGSVLTGKKEDAPKKRNVRKSPITGGILKLFPNAKDLLHSLGDYLQENQRRIFAPSLVKNSHHLFEIGLAIIERYKAMKRQRGKIDFNDQIERCANLLAREDIRDWIRYRLDMGVDHVLVDEAQDTSPAQWKIINAITEDFHVGEGASTNERTMFVVGDEKQSIFSFQGAEPEEFDRQRAMLQKLVQSASKNFHPGELRFSFRSTPDILHAVDKVFDVEANRIGLTKNGEKTIHDSVRETNPGEVQVWPVFEKAETPKVESWLDPIDHTSDSDPSIQLAKRMADEIKSMVGKRLPGMERELQFRDILVLVRSRDQFITALTRIMKEKGLAIAGADRLKLTEHIAVEDMIAVGRACLLPQDDLSLACTLKSLFFNLSDDDIFSFAYQRAKQVSLFEEISNAASDLQDPRHSLASAILKEFSRLQELALTGSAFEFFAGLFGALKGRKKILARLGSEAEDVMDAFLDEALNFTRDGNGGLEEFIAAITKAEPIIKREVELNRDEVRILTVHSSKGLEAPVVFLVDPCGPAWRTNHSPKIMQMPSENAYAPMVWIPSVAQHTSETFAAERALETAADAEYRRLLYVGMTRAADRLIVCGYSRSNARNHPHWHQMVHDALAENATEIKNANDEVISLRWVAKEKPAIASRKPSPSRTTSETEKIPEWLFTKPKLDPRIPRPLTPSGATAYIEGLPSPHADAAVKNTINDSQFALQKGNVTHKLLEILPDLNIAEREQVAKNYIEKACENWNKTDRENIFNNIFEILASPDFLELFTGDAGAEISVGGWIELGNQKIQVAGQIDRLVVSDEKVIILDYKTNFTVPAREEDAATQYKIQLGLYRDLMRQIYPSHKIVSALLWTQTPELMSFSDHVLDSALQIFNKS